MAKKKYDHNYVFNYFKEHDCLLLNNYVDSKSSLQYLCKCGNIANTNFPSYKNSKHKKCKKCISIENNPNSIFTYEYVFNYFKENDCLLLEKTYVNANTPMQYVCVCGNHSTIRFYDFKNGKRCKECGRKKLSDSKKFTYEFVKSYFTDNNYTLISDDYNGNSSKLLVKCPEGHQYETTFQNFRLGYRCGKCANNIKFTYEEVYEFFKKHNCELLDTQYVTSNDKLKYKCKCGEISFTTFNHFKNRNQQCRNCSFEQVAESNRLNIEFVSNFIFDYGYILLSKEYKNSHQLLEIKCENGHIYEASFDAFKRGNRCPTCSGRNKYDIENIKEIFNENNCILLEKEYKNTKTAMNYICECGNKSKISLSSFLRGSRCKECGIEKTAIGNKLTYSYLQNEFKKQGCLLLSEENEYHNKYSYLDFQCKCGRKSKTNWAIFKQSFHCKYCGFEIIGDKIRKYTIDDLKEEFKDKGCLLLNSNYKNSKDVLYFICPKGHLNKTTLHLFRKKEEPCTHCHFLQYRGENHPGWKEERSNEDRLFRRQYPAYYEWRSSVFERDDYICQCCGKKSGNKNAHHLYGYNKYKNLRLDINNGITLCEDCHFQFHKIYGFRDNTKEQYEEYIVGNKWSILTRTMV